MKPTSKQLDDLKASIAAAKGEKGLSNAEIARISDVHPSQVGRICEGGFRTFSFNVVRICKALDVTVPHLEANRGKMDPALAQAYSNVRRLWEETPESAAAITRILNLILDLQNPRKRKDRTPTPQTGEQKV